MDIPGFAGACDSDRIWFGVLGDTDLAVLADSLDLVGGEMTEVKLKLRTPQEVYDYLIEGEDDAMVITKLTTLHFAYQREIERLDKSGRIYAATITDLREEIRQLRLTLTDWNRANVEMSDEVDRLRRALLDRDQRLDAALGKLSGERR